MNSNNIIDCDADPVIPMGWYILKHNKQGKITWDSKKVELMTQVKSYEHEVTGDEFVDRMNNGEDVQFNANVLDYLIENQYQIPKVWKGKCILFTGTIYEFVRPFPKENRREWFCVRLLVWHEYGWISGFRWLGSKFTDYHNVIIPKK